MHAADALPGLTLVRYILQVNPAVSSDVHRHALLIFLAAVPADFLPYLRLQIAWENVSVIPST